MMQTPANTSPEIALPKIINFVERPQVTQQLSEKWV
jgi:hypothetical protein